MYLSQIRLATGSGGRGSLAALLSAQAGSYDAHRLVWSLFGDASARERDFLFRVDRRPEGVTIHTLSHRLPADETGLFEVETKAVDLKFTVGQKLDFLLLANPIRTRNGQRHDVVLDRIKALRVEGASPDTMEVAQTEGAAWITRQGASAGFDVMSSTVRNYGQRQFAKPRGPRVKLAVMELSGQIQINDPHVFRDAVLRGFGKGKAYGCGLMLLRSVPADGQAA